MTVGAVALGVLAIAHGPAGWIGAAAVVMELIDCGWMGFGGVALFTVGFNAMRTCAE